MSYEPRTKLTYRVELSMTERGWAALHSALIAERAEATDGTPDLDAPLESLLADAFENGVDIEALAASTDGSNPPWGDHNRSPYDLWWTLRTVAWWDDRASGRLGYENDEAELARSRGYLIPNLFDNYDEEN